MIADLQRFARVRCGFASIANIHTKTHIDRMERCRESALRAYLQDSFFLSETLKYLFLLFDPDNAINRNYDAVFTTEGHPLLSFRSSSGEARFGAPVCQKANFSSLLDDISTKAAHRSTIRSFVGIHPSEDSLRLPSDDVASVNVSPATASARKVQDGQLASWQYALEVVFKGTKSLRKRRTLRQGSVLYVESLDNATLLLQLEGDQGFVISKVDGEEVGQGELVRVPFNGMASVAFGVDELPFQKFVKVSYTNQTTTLFTTYVRAGLIGPLLDIKQSSFNGRVCVLSDDPYGCESHKNLGCSGKDRFIVVAQRGMCTFSQKLLNAQGLTASALLVVSDTNGTFQMVDELGHEERVKHAIPAFMMTSRAGSQLLEFSKRADTHLVLTQSSFEDWRDGLFEVYTGSVKEDELDARVIVDDMGLIVPFAGKSITNLRIVRASPFQDQVIA